MSGSRSPRIGVVGGGILGLAVARRITEVIPGSEVELFEKEDGLAQHQTGRNSGVVHAGLYYAPGSLKATLCRRGATLLLDYVERKSLSISTCGKSVVAITPSELPLLDDILERAIANGVPGARKVSQAELAEIEPNVSGLAAIHSPTSAIVDYTEVAESLALDLREAGGAIRLSHQVRSVRRMPRAIEIVTDSGDHPVDAVVTCAGLQADRLARDSDDDKYPTIVPFSGDYYVLSAAKQDQVRGLVYPVPDPRLPFLGVHLTKRLDGSVVVGPNALLALGREAYGRRDLSVRDLRQVFATPPFWKFARRYAGAGAKEVLNRSRGRFARAASRYLPGIEVADLSRGPRGIRAQAIGRDGALVDDFVISDGGRVLHVRNAPSPAATSSLAIAERVVARLASSLEA